MRAALVIVGALIALLTACAMLGEPKVADRARAARVAIAGARAACAACRGGGCPGSPELDAVCAELLAPRVMAVPASGGGGR